MERRSEHPRLSRRHRRRTPTERDPHTLTGDALGAIDVIANQANANTITSGGVAEFDGIADPTVALQGSGTADAPPLVLYLDATGRQNVRVQFNARDIDGSADNATQQLNVQYRIGETGTWTNVTGRLFRGRDDRRRPRLRSPPST